MNLDALGGRISSEFIPTVKDLEDADFPVRFGAIYPDDDPEHRLPVALQTAERGVSYWGSGFVTLGARAIADAFRKADHLADKGTPALVTIAGHTSHQHKPRLAAVVILPVHHTAHRWSHEISRWSAMTMTQNGIWQVISARTSRDIAVSTALAACDVEGCDGLITVYPPPIE